MATSTWVAVIGTSSASTPSARACSTSWASTLATRLCTVWKDWLASRSLVARSRRESAASQRDRQLRALEHQPPHVRAEQRQRLDVVDRLDGGRALLVVEHRQLAEDVAGAERGQRDLAAVAVLADGARVAGADHVARVRVVALAEYRLAGREAPRVREVGHAAQVGLLAARRTPGRARAAPRGRGRSPSSPMEYHGDGAATRQAMSSARSRRRRTAIRPATAGERGEQPERRSGRPAR